MTELFYYKADSTSNTDTTSIGSALKTFISSAKQKFLPDKEEPEIHAGLNLFKNQDGRWTWIGVFTNNFRDHDSRPEIFSAESHRRYVKSVESGEKDYPYLYLYHEPKWKIGKATTLALDEVDEDIVFVIAGGYIDADKSDVAERIANSGRSFQMSHGVPYSEIKRNEKDMTIFDEYWSEEVSVVPYGRAANPFTTFGVINGDKNMIAQEKRNEMVQSLNLQDDSLLTNLEAANKNMAAKAKEHHEFKEKSENPDTEKSEQSEATAEVVAETETPTQVEAETPEQPVVEVEETPDEQPEEGLDLEQALLTLAKNQNLSMKTQLDLQNTLKSLTEKVDGLEKQLQGVKAQREKQEETPTSKSLFESLVSGIEKSAAALVNENDELAKSKPQEAEETPAAKASVGNLQMPWLNNLIANGQKKV